MGLNIPETKVLSLEFSLAHLAGSAMGGDESRPSQLQGLCQTALSPGLASWLQAWRTCP